MKKNVLLIIGVLVLFAGCASAPKQNVTHVENAIKNEIIVFRFGDDLYFAVQNGIKNYAFKVNTEDVSFADKGNTMIILLDKNDVYEVSLARLKDVPGLSKNDSDKVKLQKYYEWEKEFQETNAGVTFLQENFRSFEDSGTQYIAWDYKINSNLYLNDETKIVETKGYTFVSGDYFVTIMECIDGGSNVKAKNEEYKTLYKRITIFDSEINENTVNQVLGK